MYCGHHCFRAIPIIALPDNMSFTLGETSKLIGCSHHIQQTAAAKLHSNCYASLLVAAALWLQRVVRNFDVSSKLHHGIGTTRREYCNSNMPILPLRHFRWDIGVVIIIMRIICMHWSQRDILEVTPSCIGGHTIQHSPHNS